MNQPMQLLTSKKTVEWYTPSWLIDLAREFMGGIDFDPASCPRAQEWIQAGEYVSLDQGLDGLEEKWWGRVWLNPPFSDTKKWGEKFLQSWDFGEIDEGLLLVNSNLGYGWYERLARRLPSCQLFERVKFIKEDGTSGGASKRGQTIFYAGPYIKRKRDFGEFWKDLGRIYVPR